MSVSQGYEWIAILLITKIIIFLFSQKRRDRESAVLRNKKLSEEQKTKWLKVMKIEMMSSEESEMDDDNRDELLKIRSLPWRSSEVNRMFSKIDAYNLAGKSPASRRQMKRKKRVEETSSRQLTTEIRASLPDFAFNNWL